MKYDHILAIPSCTDLPDLAWQIRMSCEALADDDEISTEVLQHFFAQITKKRNAMPESSDRLAMNRVLRVCRESGCRRQGIHKRIAENKNLVRCLYKEHVALDQHFLLFVSLAESFKIFFDDIVDALKGTFPDVGKESDAPIGLQDTDFTACLNKVLEICGTGGENIVHLQNANRNIMYLLINNSSISSKLAFIESWLEDHELFLVDLHHALEGVFERVHQTRDFVSPSLAWVGNDFTGCQICFNTSKFAKLFNVLRRTCHWKRSRTMYK